jgi:hypothetical protein
MMKNSHSRSAAAARETRKSLFQITQEVMHAFT